MKPGPVGQFFWLLLNPRVHRSKKLLFLLIVIAYWLAPDLMPFLPLDDLLVTLLGSWLFVQAAKRDVSSGGNGGGARPGRAKEYIDVEGHVVDDDGD